jgi:hypothetical protein
MGQTEKRKEDKMKFRITFILILLGFMISLLTQQDVEKATFTGI